MVAGEDGISHHVYPFPPSGDPDDGQLYLRVQEFSGSKALVHWWYLPDSYDEWISREYAPDQLQADAPPSAGPWKVYVRWVYDSEKYNEWMNPTDYETKESQEEQEGAVAAAIPCHLSVEGESDEARMKMLVMKSSMEGVKVEVELSEVRAEGDLDSLHALISSSGGGDHNLCSDAKLMHNKDSAFKRKNDSLMEPLASLKRSKQLDGKDHVDNNMRGSGETANGSCHLTFPHVLKCSLRETTRVPTLSSNDGSMFSTQNMSKNLQKNKDTAATFVLEKLDKRGSLGYFQEYPSWFSLESIDEREKLEFPQIFSRRKWQGASPKEYKEIRNSLVALYEERNKDHTSSGMLNMPSARNHTLSIGRIVDAVTFTRIFEFMEENNIINRTKGYGTLSSGSRAAAEISQCNDSRGITMAAAAVHGGNKFFLSSRKPFLNSRAMIDRGLPSRLYCNMMPSVPLTELRYQCTKMPAIEISPEAHAQGMFPEYLTSKDFARVSHRTIYEKDEGGWSSQETFLLLNALEMFGDNWAEVAEHVGTKTQVQCMLHFLQLPIEDLFTSSLESAASVGVTKCNSSDTITPFMDSPNPILAQVAFLSSFISPMIAANYAKATLESLIEENCQASMEDELNVVNLSLRSIQDSCQTGLERARDIARSLSDQESLQHSNLISLATSLQAQKVDLKIRSLERVSEASMDEATSMAELRLNVK
ncbi:hypothetical protein CEUSTIGMA_g13911.t1 [Chlamydomonas eustigma]|uniref:SANT domain-containing protein n=1 Tax=Chlamydomonas eustigma TaxID=1157962 RepID=A0A250XU03_9CHLO|nr:hypothetical protein CEUSTIGMA_g13911.t1 [Chlamydomonas eustigma]|eukprot:GAX86503.1 hypothetical protein CEUSTIGMA_g13911.t1 [Chlamydomonas eustigma]